MSDETSCSGSAIFDLTSKNAELLGIQDPDDFVITYHEDPVDAQMGVNAVSNPYSAAPGTTVLHARLTSVENPACFDATQSFELSAVLTPEVDIDTEVFICENTTGVEIGDPFGIPQFSYQWDTGETTSSIIVDTSGSYTLTVTNSASGLDCEVAKTVEVVISLAPRITNIEVDDLQNNNTILVQTELEEEYEYQLDSGSVQASNLFTNVAPGLHTVTVTDPKGCGSDTEQVTVVGFPKFFTPNGDGMNDYWHILGIETLQEPVVRIFNRYGMLLKELTPQSVGWDGTFNGRDLPSTDYWFKLSYIDNQGERVVASYINNHFALRR